MQCGAGLAFTIDHGPVDRNPPAIFWQVRAVQVERPQGRNSQYLRRDHIPVVEREDKIRCNTPQPFHVVRIIDVGRQVRNIVLICQFAYRVKPDLLGGRVFVRKDQGNLRPLAQELGDTTVADVMIGADDQSVIHQNHMSF